MTFKALPKKDINVLAGAIILLAALRIFTFYYTPDEPDLELHISVIWVSTASLLIFVFNFSFDRLLNFFLAWKKYAITRFLTQMIGGALISLWVLNISYNIIKDQFTSAPPDPNQMLLLNIYGFAIILPFFSFYFGFKFLKAWRKSEVESEQLQKENARSQMMTLKNHLDPHFLFNNLNILSSLMDKDVELSKSYLDKFAEVYRIILRTEYSDLTTVEEEMRLIESYIYLLKIRFEDSVFFDLDVSEKHKKRAIPPLSIQMLVENVIKHNMASKEKPIYIQLKAVSDDYILISNNIQEKKYGTSKREGTGLNNIRKRYEFFTDKTLTVEKVNDQFVVTLPLLEIEYN